ncbi:MAG: Serine/threonine-protein kinase PknD [Gammaproteobacteria bacterium]|nr:Serine/threonine-protein kinase PknD [Gammaproteobacteria bacterium]
MQAFLIHQSEDFRLLLSQYLAILWPDVQVVDCALAEWEAVAARELADPPDFVIVGHDDANTLRAAANELAVRFSGRPLLCIGEAVHEPVVRPVLQGGICVFLPVQSLSRATLSEVLNRLLAERTTPVMVRSEDVTDRLVFTGDGEPAPDAVDFCMNGKPIRIRGYRLMRKIGEGGMSRVFIAEREADGQELVLKILDGSMMQDPVQLQRFMHEYRIVAQVDSPWVVKIFDQGFTDDHVFIAMEHFPGGDLKQQLGRPFAPNRALSLLWAMGMALDSIHQHGIVHRDLKPPNIMFRADRSLALVDFGVSQMDSIATEFTQSGELVGTPLYMSPEQGSGRAVDARSDLYSLGAIFYEMLTARRVFTAKSLMMIIHMHATEPPPRLPPSLSAMQELLDRLLAKVPGERFQSAREVLVYVKSKWGDARLKGEGAVPRSREGTAPAGDAAPAAPGRRPW